MTQLSRRRFLTISAACAALPTGALAAPVARWRGTAMGAGASLRLEGLNEAQAAPIIAAVEAELERLELIFSLYRPASQLSRLNRDGRLNDPAPELLDVLSLCASLHAATGGAFDPSVQPLWLALARGDTADEVARAKAAVGWHGVRVVTGAVVLSQPGLSGLTLNGIAQGAVTDRISGLLRSHGLTDVLVDMGEIAALGGHADGSDWRVGLAGPDGTMRQRITLRDRAVATSAPAATVLAEAQGHILDPRGGNALHRAVSVSAPSAAVADGLSTALCLVPKNRIGSVLSRFPRSKLEMLI
ncbi:FAD:protein FMN transferase [Ruegeria sediminis]|uniref:FAD:protein FMN transferase n=1 Tax=Ruegeria sediminis TaxID=2583820 RepID=A0ABY2WSJ0_9RHOB|nr:FAD:protein FMN transferase [Ruegeria sediminis]TMV03372.1 FAD:protein FMN transferase [Ruegeria sediminis]